ncbi:alpha/beta fold hydrolase [Chitinophaga sp. Cy-1792]|uniref:alpha/beta fold hydrolase n=1 Tax=Chitinophaga sp. Cy-1792 TaxID=2608339 RepID=UPI001421F971|nr:alpha/beta hydrolase [Chitinophaga sp. Cy-1792]NIG53089.1 alpha/beta hydrolase [Chitinophaga sp. Cy-1792]
MKKSFFLFLILATAALFLNLFANAQTSSNLQVKVEGKGKQVAIFIPGFTCSGDVFKETAAALNKDYTCHIFTMPGYAGAPADANPSLEKWADEIVAYVRKNHLTKPVIIGHSLGGGMALMLATKYPDVFSKLVIVDALPCLNAAFNPEFKSVEHPDCSKMAARIMPLSDSAMYKMQLANLQRLIVDTVHREEIAMWGVKSDRKTYLDTYCEFYNMDQRQSITAIKIPTLVLLESVFANYKPAIESQYTNLKTATLKYATKGLHFIMYDDQEWYLNQITEFLR